MTTQEFTQQIEDLVTSGEVTVGITQNNFKLVYEEERIYKDENGQIITEISGVRQYVRDVPYAVAGEVQRIISQA